MSIEIPLVMSVSGSGAWTKDMEDFLSEAYSRTGLTSAQIRDGLNEKFKTKFSRNAVIGKINRLGLREKHEASHTARVKNHPGRPMGRPRAEHRAQVHAHKVGAPQRQPNKEVGILLEELSHGPAAPPVGGIPYTELNNGNCHWPLGSFEARPPYMYCGAPALTGCPYCATHYRQGIDPTKNPRWRKIL